MSGFVPACSISRTRLSFMYLSQSVLLLAGLCSAAPALAWLTVERPYLEAPVEGASGEFEAAIDGRSGNTSRQYNTVGGKLLYRAGDTTMMVMADHMRSKAGDPSVRIEDNTLVHAHYTDHIRSGLAAEAFAQYEQDDFRLLDNRSQVGVGARFTLDYQPQVRDIVLGAGALYEWENQIENDSYWRANLYLTYKRQLSVETRVIYAGYWQPRLDDVSDSLFINDLAVAVSMGTKLELRVGARGEHDDEAPKGLKNDEWRYQTSVAYRW